MKKTYRLEGKPVSLATIVVTAFVRLVFFVLALVVLAVSTPLTATEVFGAGIALILLAFAKTTVLELEER